MRQAIRINLIGIIVAWAWLLLASSVGIAAIPQADDPDAYTEKQYRLDLLEFNKRTMSQAYLEVGSRDPKWDELAVELLDGQAVQYTNSKAFRKAHAPGEITKGRKNELIHQLKELNCDDPLVAYVIQKQGNPDEFEGIRATRKAYIDLTNSDYPAIRRNAVAWHFERELRKLELEDEADRVLSQWVDQMCQTIDDSDLTLDDQYFMFRLTADEIKGDWLPRWRMVCERIEGQDVANPWLANAIIGFYHTEAAGQIRIKDYGFNPKSEGWDEYLEHLRIAEEHLVKAWESAPQYPVVAYKMIKVSVCRSAGQERLWFDRAVDAQADFYSAYAFFLWSQRPRYGGSLDQMYAFAVECLDTGRFDTRIPEIFYDAMIKLYDETDDYSYWRRPGVYESLARYYENKKHEPMGRSSDQWWDSMKAAAAWRVGRYEQAAQQMQAMGADFIPKTFSKFGGEPVLAQSEVYVRLNPVTDQAADDVDRLWRQYRPRRAAELLDPVLAGLAPNDPARVYLENKAAQSRWKHRRQQGVWADLLGRTDLGGWDVERGEWEMDEQGRLIGHSLSNGLAAVCRLKFGYRYELKGSVELLDAPEPKQANVGILMAYQVSGSRAYHRDVLLFPNQQSVLAARSFNYAKTQYPADLNSKNTFHLQVWDRHVRLAVNDQLVIDHRVMPRSLSRTIYRFALGGKYHEPGATIRFNELKIRRLKQRPDWTNTLPRVVSQPKAEEE